jgi:hypothetical protein
MAAQQLARVNVDPDTIWYVTLMGGEDVGQGKQFEIEGNNQDGPKAEWVLKLNTPRKGNIDAKSEDVAKLWYEGGNLVFKWSDAGKVVPAGALESCQLDIQVEAESKILSLIEPKVMDPLPVTIGKKLPPVKFEAESLPDPAKLKFEATEISGVSKPKEQIALLKEPAEPVGARQPVMVGVTYLDADKNRQTGVLYQVTFTANRGVLTVNQILKAPSAADLRRFGVSLPLSPDAINAINDTIAKADKRIKDAHGKKANQPGHISQQEKQQLEQGIKLGRHVLAYNSFLGNLGDNAKIHYRVFMDAGEGRQVDILRSEPPQPAAGAAKKPAGPAKNAGGQPKKGGGQGRRGGGQAQRGGGQANNGGDKKN